MYELINANNIRSIPTIFKDWELSQLFSYLHKRTQRYARNTYFGWAALRDLTIIQLMFDTAMRPAECFKLKLSSVNIKDGIVAIQYNTNKQHKGRTVTISSPVLRLLKDYLSHPLTSYYRSNTDYLFPNFYFKSFTMYSWPKNFTRLLKAAGIYRKRLKSYSLRHTKLTQIYNHSHDVFLCGNFAGHVNLESTRLYIHLSQVQNGYFDYMRSVQEKLSKVPF